jgi:thiol reductant ABC exporter CydC subunit
MKRLLKVFEEERWEMLAAVLLGGCSLGAAVGLLATSAWLISMASTKPPVLVLEVAIVSVRFFGLSRGILKYGSRVLEHNSALKIQTALRVRIYERFSRLLPSDFLELHRGNLLAQIMNDVELAQDLWLRIAAPWLAALISGTAGITIIHWLLPTAGKVLGLIFLISIFVIPFLAMVSSSKSDTRKHESELFDQIMQISESAPESLLFNFDQELLNQIDEAQGKITIVEKQNANQSGLASATYFISLGLTVILALWFAARGLAAHQLAGINVAVIALVPLAIFDGLSSLPAAFSGVRQVLGAINNLEPLIGANSADDYVDSPRPAKVALELQSLLPIIEGAKTRSISTIINSGDLLLITGRSGTGKSSIINSILGFIPFSGKVLLNDSPISAADQYNFSTLLQDDYLFGTSIRENLKIGNPEADDSELFRVLTIVELDRFVHSLPEGLDTMVGPLGLNFSGGEKQRMKLARLLLRDTPIVILDEPFEFLDSQMVDRIANKVVGELHEKAVIIVSHLPLPMPSQVISL